MSAPSPLTTNSVAATSTSSNPSSSSGSTLSLASTVPLAQNIYTAIHLKQIGESTTASATVVASQNEIAPLQSPAAVNLKKLTSIASPLTSSSQSIANIINTQSSGIVKPKIMVRPFVDFISGFFLWVVFENFENKKHQFKNENQIFI